MPASTITAVGRIREGIYDALQGSISVDVFDEAPQGTAFPYVTFGDSREQRFDVHGRGGKSAVIVLDIWGRERGFKELEDIAEEIDGILDQRPESITVTGFRVVHIEHESMRQMRVPNLGGADAAVPTRHLVLQYRVQVTETP